MPAEKITIEIDSQLYVKIKNIATALFPQVMPLPDPNHIINFLADEYIAAGPFPASVLIKARKKPKFRLNLPIVDKSLKNG